jgi:ABC-type amino acid transport substrate-binding protein
MPLRPCLSGLALAAALCVAVSAVDANADDAGITILVGRSPPSVRWEGGKLTGYWVELPRLAAARAKVPIRNIEPVPYVRALRDVAAGDDLCHPFVARTPARESHYRWIAPTRRIVISAFVIAGTADPPKSTDDLRHREIAVQRDTFGDATLIALDIPATRVTDTNQLGILLAHDRVSAFVAEYASGISAAKQAGIAVDEAMQVSETLGYFVCSPSLDTAVAERLTRAVNEIFAQGLDRPLAAADGDSGAYGRVRPPIQ